MLFDPVCDVSMVASVLDANHYLGRARRGFAWSDEYGVVVLCNPSSRHLPADWLELSRWCLRGEKNDGSRQWKVLARWLKQNHSASTVVSYSDPSVGHTGALYRACNWWWAPTWHRIAPPPSAVGSWDGATVQAVKDRWVFPLRRDPRRVGVLRLDDVYVRRFPECEYREPGGADFKTFVAREV